MIKNLSKQKEHLDEINLEDFNNMINDGIERKNSLPNYTFASEIGPTKAYLYFTKLVQTNNTVRISKKII